MTLAEAKEIIAAYLSSSRPIGREELLRARAVAGPDERYMQFLQAELALDEDWYSECELFVARVAEFSELTGPERAAEIPELVAHVDSCAACRRAYWEIRPLWKTRLRERLAGRAGAAGKVLTDGIRLALSGGGDLLEQGLGPPARQEPGLAAGMDARLPDVMQVDDLAARTSARKEWELRDEESGRLIRLIVRGQTAAVAVECEFEAPSEIAAEQIWFEIRAAESDALTQSGWLSGRQMSPIILSFGGWVIRLEVTAGTQAGVWEIPIRLEAANDEAKKGNYDEWE